jgi:hypothetical protein
VATKKGMTTIFLLPLSFVAVLGSGMDKNQDLDKFPGSATLLFWIDIQAQKPCGLDPKQ